MNRHIWEGWTVGMFISELAPIVEMIMTGQSWRRPFTSKAELADWHVDISSLFNFLFPPCPKGPNNPKQNCSP